MKTIVSLLVGLLFLYPLKAQQGFIVDHHHTDLSQIPDQWIDSAKQNLKIRYFRRSHGSHIDLGGMTSLIRYSAAYQTKYAFSKTATTGSLFLSTQASNEWNSLDFENATWVAITRSYLDDPANADINVIMWAWSSYFYQCSATDYVDDMEMLIGEYGPGGSKINSGDRTTPVTFIFQTACGQRSSSRNYLVYMKNDTIRNHCVNNNRILFDFNDLECYNPDGNYFGDGNPDGSYTSVRMLNDDLAYKSSNPGGSVHSGCRNWGIDWMNSNPNSELTKLAADNFCTNCAHSEGNVEGETKDNSRLHCVLKGRAAWWLWARLAGWQSKSVSISSASSLTELNLDAAVISISLSGDTLVDGSLSGSNFQLLGAPPGTTVESVSYINSQQAQLALAFDGTDFDTDSTNFRIEIAAAELTGGQNLQSNALSIQAIDEGTPVAQISVDTQLTETNLNSAVVHLLLQNESFIDLVLTEQNFGLLHEPAGCSISAANYLSDTTCNLTLSFDGTDFDTDSTNFRIEIAAAELTGGQNLQSNALSIQAIDEGTPVAQISVDNQLTETNLNSAVVHLLLQNESFTDQNLAVQNFGLLHEPAGCSISAANYLSDTTCNLTLSFDGTDFDTDSTNFRIEIAAAELTGGQNLQSNALSIQAIDEGTPVAQISVDTQLTETNLNSAVVHLLLQNESFTDQNLAVQNFGLLHEPAGCTISAANYLTDTTCNLTLSFDGTDFDTDSTNFRVEIAAVELTGGQNLQSNALSIQAIDEDQPAATLSIDEDLIESSLDSSVVHISLTNDTFNIGGRNEAEFVLLNAPQGLSVDSFDISDTKAVLYLAFDGTDFDEDSVNFCVLIGKEFLLGGTDLLTNSVVIEAENETYILKSDVNQNVKLYPNPGNGHFSLEFDFQLSKNALVKIIDIDGKTVFEQVIYASSVKKTDFDLSYLKAGNYFFVLNNGQKRIVKSLIIH